MSLWLYLLYCYLIMQSLCNVYKSWTFTLKKGLLNYPNGQGTGFPIQGPGFKSAGWLKLIKWVPESPGNLMVKNKLSPGSGSVSLR